MTRLTVDEYLNKTPSDEARERHRAYLTRQAEEKVVVQAWMVPFRNPEFLAGPYAGGYALATISDWSLLPGYRKRLKTQTEVFNNHVSYVTHTSFSYPADVVRAAGFPRVEEYISGWHVAETLQEVSPDDPARTLHFFQRDTLPDSATLEHAHLKRDTCSNSTMDGLDFVAMFRIMTETMTKEQILESLAKSEEKMRKQIETFRTRDMKSDVSIEQPVVLRISGNDDASWSRVFSTVEQAEMALDKIEAKATRDYLWESMNHD